MVNAHLLCWTICGLHREAAGQPPSLVHSPYLQLSALGTPHLSPQGVEAWGEAPHLQEEEVWVVPLHH